MGPSPGGRLVSCRGGGAGGGESRRTPTLAPHPADAVPPLAKSFVRPWTCLLPTTASQEPLVRPLVLQPRRWPPAVRANQELAGVAPCKGTGIEALPRPRKPVHSPDSP